METVVFILGIVNVAVAIFNTKARKEVRLFSLFAGVFCIVTGFILMS